MKILFFEFKANRVHMIEKKNLLSKYNVFNCGNVVKHLLGNRYKLRYVYVYYEFGEIWELCIVCGLLIYFDQIL